jgi:carbamoylphosphate synthase large subunit
VTSVLCRTVSSMVMVSIHDDHCIIICSMFASFLFVGQNMKSSEGDVSQSVRRSPTGTLDYSEYVLFRIVRVEQLSVSTTVMISTYGRS